MQPTPRAGEEDVRLEHLHIELGRVRDRLARLKARRDRSRDTAFTIIELQKRERELEKRIDGLRR